MAGARVELDLGDLRDKLIEPMKERLDDLEPVLAKEAKFLDGEIQRGFASSTSPHGTPWKPLRPSTMARRRNKSDARPLVDDGILRGNIVVESEAPASITFGVGGTRAITAKTHQFGRKGGGFHGSDIPARPFLPLDADGKEDFSSGRAKKWFDRMMKRVIKYVVHGKGT